MMVDVVAAIEMHQWQDKDWRIREVAENWDLACQVPDRFLTGSGFQCVQVHCPVVVMSRFRSLRFVN